jgi:hypothetical protein
LFVEISTVEGYLYVFLVVFFEIGPEEELLVLMRCSFFHQFGEVRQIYDLFLSGATCDFLLIG